MYVSKYHIYLNIRIPFIWDNLLAQSSVFEKLHIQNKLISVCVIIIWLHSFRHDDSTILDMFTKLWKATVWHPLDGFSWNFMFGDFFENLLKKFKFDYNLTRITGTLHEDICIFMISCWMLLRMRNISDKSCREIRTYVLYSITFYENCTIYETICKNMSEPEGPQMTV
jgi:hypothetical protein